LSAYHIISYLIRLYHIVDVKHQNRVIVETDKQMKLASDDYIQISLLESHVLSWRRKVYSKWEDVTSSARAFQQTLESMSVVQQEPFVSGYIVNELSIDRTRCTRAVVESLSRCVFCARVDILTSCLSAMRPTTSSDPMNRPKRRQVSKFH